jgi:hypothetical protein
MRGSASVPVRIKRLSERQYERERDAAIAQAAIEYEIDEAELRAEILAWEGRCRRYGLESMDDVFRRTAAELGIDEAVFRAEIDQIRAERGERS